MTPELAIQLDALRDVGWRIARLDRAAVLPPTIAERYEWAPPMLLDFVAGISEATSPDEKAWLLSASDYAGTSQKAFAWNEWELIALSAAEDDESWKSEITQFWDQHLPFLMSLKSGYAYFAIERTNNTVVVGEEPSSRRRAAGGVPVGVAGDDRCPQFGARAVAELSGLPPIRDRRSISWRAPASLSCRAAPRAELD